MNSQPHDPDDPDARLQELQTALFEEIKQARILLVDDDPITLEMLKEVFVSQGYAQVALAENGLEALELTLAWRPSLVLLDLSMPKMDGYEYCRRVRALTMFRSMPILVQSGLSDPWQVVAAFEAGATDMVGKPFNEKEVLARARVHLSNSALLAELRGFQERIQEELEIARAMQAELLPTAALIQQLGEDFGLEIVSCFRTCSELGGDFMGLRDTQAGSCAFFVADFSGHGINAALNTFRLHTLMEEHREYQSAPVSYLTQLNARLCELLTGGQFATMFYGVFEPASGEISYAATGCPAPLLFKAQGELRELDACGLPLGISQPLFEAAEQRLAFERGDTLWIFSDALVESQNRAREMFGTERLKTLLSAHHDQPCQTQLDVVLDTLQNHSAGVGIKDDLTILVLRRRV